MQLSIGCKLQLALSDATFASKFKFKHDMGSIFADILGMMEKVSGWRVDWLVVVVFLWLLGEYNNDSNDDGRGSLLRLVFARKLAATLHFSRELEHERLGVEAHSLLFLVSSCFFFAAFCTASAGSTGSWVEDSQLTRALVCLSGRTEEKVEEEEERDGNYFKFNLTFKEDYTLTGKREVCKAKSVHMHFDW